MSPLESRELRSEPLSSELPQGGCGLGLARSRGLLEPGTELAQRDESPASCGGGEEPGWSQPLGSEQGAGVHHSPR